MASNDIDPEALKLFVENGWRFQEISLGFVRRARNGERPDVISFEELRDHGLARSRGEITTERDRQDGLRWLRERIANPNSKA